MRFNPLSSPTTAKKSPAAQPAAAPAKPPAPPSAPTRLTIKQATHTKRQCPIWIAQITDRVERREFTRLRSLADAGGGYWSSYGDVSIHGFIFFEQTKANAFVTLATGQPALAPVVAPPPPAPASPSPPRPGRGQGEVSNPPAVIPPWRSRTLSKAA